MFGLRCLILPLALGVVVVSAPGAFADEANGSAANGSAANGPTSFESRVLAITDSILQQHIDPPTRQQMFLAGIKALHRANRQPVSKGLSNRISELSTPEHFFAYLNSVRAEFGQLPRFDEILINGLFDAVPGGGGLIKADDAKVQEQLAANRYVGIGIALAMHETVRLPLISRVFYEGPAWQAGVRRNDQILEIDGQPMASKTLTDAVKRLRGRADTEVTMVVRQPDSEPRELKVTRGVTFIPTVEGYRQISEGPWQYTIDSAEDIALLRINRIGPSTSHELRKVEAKLRDKKIRGIVLDLRGGGGILHDTVMIADQLLDGGTIGYVRTLDSVTKHEARPGCLFQDIPMAVLIAEHANADRIFLTAALQDQKRAVVIGEPTFGETYVKSHISIAGGDQIRLAIGILQRADGTTLLRPRVNRWTPNHVTVRVVGKASEQVKRKPPFIMPDHVVRFSPHSDRSEAEIEQLSDPMLAKAIEVLRVAGAEAEVEAEAEAEVETKQESVSG